MRAVTVNLLAIPVQQPLFFRLTSSPTLKFNARTTANMRVTRSATRKAAADDEGTAVAEKPTENPPPAAKAATRKRKASGESPSEPAKKARATKTSAAITAKPATQKTEAGSASAPPPAPSNPDTGSSAVSAATPVFRPDAMVAPASTASSTSKGPLVGDSGAPPALSPQSEVDSGVRIVGETVLPPPYTQH